MSVDRLRKVITLPGVGPLAGWRADGRVRAGSAFADRHRFAAALEACFDHLRAADDRPAGTLVEFGGGRGESLAGAALAIARRALPLRLVSFASFEAVRPDEVDEGWHPGHFSSSADPTRRVLATEGLDPAAVTVVRGWFEATLTEETWTRHRLGTVAAIVVDLDCAAAAGRVLAFCLPKVAAQALLVVDPAAFPARGDADPLLALLDAHPAFEATALADPRIDARALLIRRR